MSHTSGFEDDVIFPIVSLRRRDATAAARLEFCAWPNSHDCALSFMLTCISYFASFFCSFFLLIPIS